MDRTLMKSISCSNNMGVMDNPIHMNKDKVPAIPMLNKLATHTQSLHHHKAHTATGAVELMVRAVQIPQEPLPPQLTVRSCRER